MRHTILCLALCCAGLNASTHRILIVSGSGQHPGRQTSIHLRQILEKTGKFDVRVNEEAAGLGVTTLAGYDAVVLDATKATPAIDTFVRAGGGLVRTHASEECGARALHEIKLLDAKHTVTSGVSDSFTTSDSLGPAPTLPRGAVVLAATAERTRSGHTAVAWAYPDGKGRVFESMLGHSLSALQEIPVETMFTRAVEWAASGKVTPPRPRRAPIRALVVTGGHGYESSFYTIFDHPDLVWKHAVNNAEAFGKDIRDRYDVLILYNMTDEISEAGKQNLTAFVEAGKGVVVLHHAVLSFRNWDWWREQVTGTRPMTKERQGPGPGFMHDVDLVLTEVEPHPITQGLHPMHIVDETYAMLEFSPKAKVLMKTDHPTSNGPVVWLGTHPKARVVSIQLGHDHTSHLHEGFRTLFHRGILWSAGRLK
jgi:type 1 glutamine amidotransferase